MIVEQNSWAAMYEDRSGITLKL